MTEEGFLNSYHNASTPPSPEVPPALATFTRAADLVLEQASELARVLTRAHQGAATLLSGEGWANARKYFSLSEKYAAWAEYQSPAMGAGIHAYAHKVRRPLRLNDQELRAHPEWRGFGVEADRHPPMRGWLVVPLIGSDGSNYGFIRCHHPTLTTLVDLSDELVSDLAYALPRPMSPGRVRTGSTPTSFPRTHGVPDGGGDEGSDNRESPPVSRERHTDRAYRSPMTEANGNQKPGGDRHQERTPNEEHHRTLLWAGGNVDGSEG